MSNYCGKTRSNYFSVKDEERFLQIMSRAVTNEQSHFNTSAEVIEGMKKWSFSINDSLCGFPPTSSENVEEEEMGGCEYDMDGFHKALQAVVADDDAILITEIGNEAMRYFRAHTTIITSHSVHGFDHYNGVLDKTRCVLKNEHFSTRFDY